MKKKIPVILFTYMQYVHGFRSSYPTIDKSEYYVDIWKRERESAFDAKSYFNWVLSYFNSNDYLEHFF
jgi:hypothetical protein